MMPENKTIDEIFDLDYVTENAERIYRLFIKEHTLSTYRISPKLLMHLLSKLPKEALVILRQYCDLCTNGVLPKLDKRIPKEKKLILILDIINSLNYDILVSVRADKPESVIKIQPTALTDSIFNLKLPLQITQKLLEMEWTSIRNVVSNAFKAVEKLGYTQSIILTKTLKKEGFVEEADSLIKVVEAHYKIKSDNFLFNVFTTLEEALLDKNHNEAFSLTANILALLNCSIEGAVDKVFTNYTPLTFSRDSVFKMLCGDSKLLEKTGHKGLLDGNEMINRLKHLIQLDKFGEDDLFVKQACKTCGGKVKELFIKLGMCDLPLDIIDETDDFYYPYILSEERVVRTAERVRGLIKPSSAFSSNK